MRKGDDFKPGGGGAQHQTYKPIFSFQIMKTLFIETRKKFPQDLDLSPLNQIPGNSISLAATIQYIDLIPKIKQYLEDKGKTVIAKQKPQVLGCQSQAFDKTADTLLLITDGKFHAINNAIQLNKEIHIFNTQTLEKITKEDLEKAKQKTKAKQTKFLSYNRIGIIISTKPGQQCDNIIGLKQKIEKQGKNTYIFQSDNVNPAELENFPDIELWINTACPGLALDSEKIVNLSDVEEFIN